MTKNEEKLLAIVLKNAEPGQESRYKWDAIETATIEVIKERLPPELIEKCVALFAAHIRAEKALADCLDQVRGYGMSGPNRMGPFYEQIEAEARARVGK